MGYKALVVKEMKANPKMSWKQASTKVLKGMKAKK